MKTLTDLRKLRHVATVAQTGSITSAANILGLTQSAVTKSVAEVEYLLGIALFERLPRGMRLTQAGDVFVEHAQRILEDTQNLVSHLSELQSLDVGQLVLGVAPSAFIGFIERPIAQFARRFPGLGVSIHTGTLDDMAQAAISGSVDVIVGAVNYLDAWTELDTRELTPLQHFFLARSGHPATHEPHVDAASLLQYPIVIPRGGVTTEAQLSRAYVSAGLTPRAPKYICDHFPIVRSIVASTDAISPVVTTDHERSQFHQFHIFEDVIDLETHRLGYAYTKQRTLTPAAQAFAQVLREVTSATT